MLARMHALLLLLSLFAPARAGDCRVYRGDSTSYGNLLVTVRGDRVYRGDSSSYGDLLATVRGDRVYRGDSSSYGQLIATIRADRIYRGDSSSYSQLLATGPTCMLSELAGAAALF